MKTLPGAEDVSQIKVGRGPGVQVPGRDSSGMRELGAAISQVGAQFQAANDARVLSNLEAETAQAYTEFQAGLDEDPDSFDQWDAQFDEFSKTQKKKVQDMGLNSNVYGSWERSVAPVAARARLKVMAKARATMVDKGLSELTTNLEAVQGLAITGTKQDREDIYGPQAQLMIERAQDTGLIKDTTAQELNAKFTAGTERARFANAINIDPELAKEGLDAGDFEVSETERPKWNKEVDAAIQNKKNQARIDGERAKKEAVKAKKLAQEQTELSFIDRLDTDKPPTLQEISKSGLDANHQLQWRKVIETEPKLNKGLYADLTSAIHGDGMYNGQPVTRDMITGAFRSGDLTKDAHNYLIGRWDKRHKPATEKDAAKENDVKLAVKVLENLKKNGKYNEDPTENSLDHARAVDDLVKWSAANPDGNPIDYVENTLVPKQEQAWYSKLIDFTGKKLAGIGKEPEADAGREEAIKYLKSKRAPASEDNINKTVEFLGGGNNDFGNRADGTKKGKGFLGVLKRPGGGVSTEISVGVDIDGENMEIPLLVPSLTRTEIDYLLNGGESTKAIVSKAVKHAKSRLSAGKNVFAD